MSGEDSTKNADQVRLSFVQVMLIGLRLIPNEVAWNVMRRLRLWEIKQMQRRLEREYQTYGRQALAAELTSEADEDRGQEMELTRKQIDFLEKEVSFLTQELQNLRQNMVAKRRHKWAV